MSKVKSAAFAVHLLLVVMLLLLVPSLIFAQTVGAPALSADVSTGAAMVTDASPAPAAAADGMTPTIESGAESAEATSSDSDPTLEMDADSPFFNLDADDLSRSAVRRPSKPLKRFGFDFFRTKSAVPVDYLAQVGPDYVLGPGDTLNILLWGSVEATHVARLDRNGEIALPRVGVISLWGQSFEQATATVRKQIEKYYTNFELNVSMGALRSIQVYLIGEVNNPGAYHISSLSTVLSALATAGGPKQSGSLRQVQLLRGGQVVATFDLYDFFLAGDQSGNLRLQSGDTLFVPLAGSLVGIGGEVRRPAIYELKEERTLTDVFGLAGGMIPSAYLHKVSVQRLEAHQRKEVLDLDINNAEVMDFQVQDRDLIRVSPISSAGGFVTLQGYVTRPGQYQLKPEMRLADLFVHYDNLLPEYFPGAARIIRIEPPEFRPAVTTVELQAALDGDLSHNILLQEYDQIEIYSRRQMEEPRFSRVEGAVLNPGKYKLYDNMRVRDLVTAAGNVQRRSYLEAAEITRFTSDGTQGASERIIVDLAAALNGDPLHNLELHPDDHLFIRSIPDFVERQTVQLQGEVLYPGTYAITKGETLASVIERAGGYTRDAYLRGAKFTRKSVQQMQQERIKQLILEEEQSSIRASEEISRRALSDEDQQAAQAMLENRRLLLAKMRDTPAIGRMVVHLTQLDNLRGSEADVVLESGDSLTIPSNPRTVMVLGQVYNPITLTYREQATVSAYLNQVGGPRESANTKEMFIIRADGTVFSQQQAGSGLSWDRDSRRWVTGGFNNILMYPGDTLLVPEEFRTRYFVRELRDISQIFFQLALGAAAVASF